MPVYILCVGNLSYPSALAHHGSLFRASLLRHGPTIPKLPPPSHSHVLLHRRTAPHVELFCNFSQRPCVSHCAPAPESPLSINQLACTVVLISLVCSRPKHATHVPPHKLIDNSPHDLRMLMTLDLPRTVDPADAGRRCSSGHQPTLCFRLSIPCQVSPSSLVKERLKLIRMTLKNNTKWKRPLAPTGNDRSRDFLGILGSRRSRLVALLMLRARHTEEKRLKKR